jgi:hypothetical protein
MNRKEVNALSKDNSVTHYELEHSKGKIDVFLEFGDEEYIIIVRDFNGKTFITFDFDTYSDMIEEYYKQ